MIYLDVEMQLLRVNLGLSHGEICSQANSPFTNDESDSEIGENNITFLFQLFK